MNQIQFSDKMLEKLLGNPCTTNGTIFKFGFGIQNKIRDFILTSNCIKTYLMNKLVLVTKKNLKYICIDISQKLEQDSNITIYNSELYALSKAYLSTIMPIRAFTSDSSSNLLTYILFNYIVKKCDGNVSFGLFNEYEYINLYKIITNFFGHEWYKQHLEELKKQYYTIYNNNRIYNLTNYMINNSTNYIINININYINNINNITV
jgi:hypothetical protein